MIREYLRRKRLLSAVVENKAAELISEFGRSNAFSVAKERSTFGMLTDEEQRFYCLVCKVIEAEHEAIDPGLVPAGSYASG